MNVHQSSALPVQKKQKKGDTQRARQRERERVREYIITKSNFIILLFFSGIHSSLYQIYKSKGVQKVFYFLEFSNLGTLLQWSFILTVSFLFHLFWNVKHTHHTTHTYSDK